MLKNMNAGGYEQAKSSNSIPEISMPTGKEFGMMPNHPTAGVIGIPILDIPGIHGLDNIGAAHIRTDNSFDREHKFKREERFESDIAPLVGKGDLNDELCDLEGLRNLGAKDNLKKD